MALAGLIARQRRDGWHAFSAEELARFPQLYRRLSTRVAELETSGTDAIQLERSRALLVEAHSLYRTRPPARGVLQRLRELYLVEVPRAVRAEWRLVASAFAIVYGLALLSAWLVHGDLELAYSLLSPAVVDQEIGQLVATAQGQPFRGNFTFGLGESPTTAGWIMAHNMGVGVLFFAAGLLPPVFLALLAVNGLMLGTYTAVAGHWNQASEISSILWCHGVLEIQAFVLAGAAGLVLARAWIAPGPWTRRHSLALGSTRAWRLLAPVFPILFVAGAIEGFVSPHAGLQARLTTAVASGLLLVVWLGLSGHARGEPSAGT